MSQSDFLIFSFNLDIVPRQSSSKAYHNWHNLCIEVLQFNWEILILFRLFSWLLRRKSLIFIEQQHLLRIQADVQSNVLIRAWKQSGMTRSPCIRDMQINAPECTWVEANDRTTRFWPSLFAYPHLLRHNRRREHSGNSR